MEDFTCWWTDDGEGAFSATSNWFSAGRAARDFAKHADDDAGGEISSNLMRTDGSCLVSVRDSKGNVTTWRISCWADIVWNADPQEYGSATAPSDADTSPEVPFADGGKV